MTREIDFSRSFGALLEESRQHLGERPSPEKLLAYHREELPETEADNVREHLAADPTLALHLLDLAADPAENGVHSGVLSAAEMADDFKNIRRQILARPEERARPPSAASPTAKETVLEKMARWFRLEQLPAFATGLAVALLASGIYLEYRLALPVPNVPSYYLFSSPQRGPGDNDPFPVLTGENGATFSFEVNSRAGFAGYLLEIRPASFSGGSLRIPGLVPVDDWLTCQVPSRSLAVGEEYVLEIYGVDGDDVQRLASHNVFVQGVATGD